MTPRRGLIAAAAIVVAAAVVRCLAANNGLWFDEVWSLRFASELHSPLGVFAIHHSNNNQLNTLWLYVLGGDRKTWPWIVYRLPAIVAGVLTVLLAWRIAARRSREAGFFALLLIAASYPLIHYSSEARGYGTALCFDLLAFDCLERYLDTRGRRTALGFWVATAGSVLSHLMFVTLYAALFVWSLIELRRREGRWRTVAAPAAWLHAVPLALLALLYLADVRHMVVGGAPDYVLHDVLVSTLSVAVGGPVSGGAVWACAAVLLLAVGLWAMRGRGASFFALQIAVVPAIALAVERPSALFVRYFLASILFFVLLLALAAGECWRRGLRVATVVLVAAFVVGNGIETERLLRVGRGDYVGAVRHMSEHTRGQRIVVSSNHDDGTRTLLGFYRRFVPPTPVFAYLEADPGARPIPQWIVLTGMSGGTEPARSLHVHGREYDLDYVAPSVELSGWSWYVFALREGQPWDGAHLRPANRSSAGTTAVAAGRQPDLGVR